MAVSISLFKLSGRQLLELAHLVSGSCCLNCFIGPSPDKYAIRFIPRENGVHTIDVKFNGTHIPGSPFQVRVGEPGQGGDAGLVTAYGAGLERGTTGNSPGARLFLDITHFAWRFLCLSLIHASLCCLSPDVCLFVLMDCPDGWQTLLTQNVDVVPAARENKSFLKK